jgi:nitrite reductase/ring-hydroxylating ferredoxin subunit
VFEAFTGAVVDGPAEDPLPPFAVRLDGESVVEA